MTPPKPRRHVPSRCLTHGRFMRNINSDRDTPEPGVETASMLIVAADHPSLIDARDRFATELRAEQRFFGRSAGTPKPFPSLISTLMCGDGPRLAAMVDGRIIGLACIQADGEASVAVVEQWRRPWRGERAARRRDRARPARRPFDGVHPFQPTQPCGRCDRWVVGRHGGRSRTRPDRTDLLGGYRRSNRLTAPPILQLRSQLLLVQ